VTFQARDHADVIDPVRLSGIRKAATVNAYSRARTRLIQENPERFAELCAEERQKMERAFDARLEATRGRKGA
jgi:hypothetical protein